MSTGAQRRVFTLPDLGEGLPEAEVVGWRVAVGSAVEVDQTVVEVETVKALVEVPVPYAGTVVELHAEVGAVVAVGAPLVSVSVRASVVGARENDGASDAAGSGHVLVGYGTAHAAPPGRRRRRAGGTPAPSGPGGGSGPSAMAGMAGQPGSGGPPEGGVGRSGPPLVISPLVRSLAHRHGVDLTRVRPSGPHGVVVRRDVEQAAAAPVSEGPEGVERIPLRGRLRAAAEKLSRGLEAPCATTWVDVDATGLIEARDALRAAEPGRNIGLLALLARICVTGLHRFPELNASMDTERGEIVRFTAVHLGIAAQSPHGLVVPVVHDAHRRTTAELAAALADLTDQVRSGGLRPASLVGGTFTLNNYGVFGVDGSTPLLHHPEAAMLGVGRITDKPWVVDGRLAVRKVTQLSLTFDHRVCDGGAAGGFLRYVADRVERPATLLADL
ncbi:dihydrolipoamide acetyltransferase family protein [Streptomyces sp. NPDC012746]|uniref:dihydrolipoamide acetyltransferase family protein n=1 Tax=Streptomyces sp. NPDC012746 TaxID=3364845 RepID=UPI003689D6B8